MDTHDLQRLFEQQSGASNLTAAGVTRHVKRQQARRRGAMAGVAALAVAGLAFGGMWAAGQSTAPIPAGPAPSASSTPEAVNAANPADISTACEVQAPQAWVDLLDGDAKLTGLPWVESDGATITWHDGDTSHVVSESAEPFLGRADTDGRFVTFLDGATAELMVWDSETPDVAPWSTGVVSGEVSPVQGGLANGRLWMAKWEDAENPDTVVSIIDLATSHDATEIFRGKGEFRAPFGDVLPFLDEAGNARWPQADGTVVDPPEALAKARFIASDDGNAIVADGPSTDAPRELYLDGSDEVIPTTAEGIDGDWVIGFDEAGAEAHDWMHNFTTGVKVELPMEEGWSYELRDGLLIKTDGLADGWPTHEVAVDSLPEVTCEG